MGRLITWLNPYAPQALASRTDTRVLAKYEVTEVGEVAGTCPSFRTEGVVIVSVFS